MQIHEHSDEVENKLVAARTRLILDRPFLGALVLRLPLQPADRSWCASTCTDAKNFYFNRDYIAGLNFAQTQFVLSAEALHCALAHFNRRGHRSQARWDLACAHAVNLILADENMQPPPDAPLDEDFRGMSAEEIYHLLDDDKSEQPQQDDGEAQDQQQPPPLSEPEREALQQQWRQRLAGAAQQAQQAGKLGESMARLIELFLQPTLPWRAVLARFMNAVSRNDYSYARPSSRRGEPAIYPSLRSAHADVIVAVDVSGSIDRDELNEFVTEIESPWIFEAWESCELPAEVDGGGGTDFRPVFDWVNQNQLRPDLLIYFTDAEGKFPQLEPDYPTLWLVKGHTDVPWGQRIQLN